MILQTFASICLPKKSAKEKMQFSEARRRASKMKLQSCTIVHISGLKAHIYDVVNDNGSFVSPLSVICLLFSHRPEPDQSSPDNAA